MKLEACPPQVAIVGIGAVFPSSQDLNQFWDHVKNGISVAREVPEDRWPVDPDKVFDPQKPKDDKVYSKRGCFVDDVRLDTSDLKISVAELEGLDPVFITGLTAAQAAYRDARMTQVDHGRTGVIIGNIVLPTEKASELTRAWLGRTFTELVAGGNAVHDEELSEDSRNIYAAGLPGILIAKALDLGGGSFTLDAACASSLYALALAAEELIAGRADAMITGGLSRPDCLYTQMGFAQLGALSANGQPLPFDKNADGLVVGEGAGMVVLKRLEDAVAHGDHIYGVLTGYGLANDTDGSLLAPSSEGQLRAMRAAYRRAGWSPSDVQLIECHATGTLLGDQIEFDSLQSLWEGESDGSAVIGSVKSNVGHLLTAAGSAALIKVLLAMREQTLPPTAGFQEPPPKMNLDESPFRVLSQAEPWPKTDKPRRAAVSAFGFGGIDAHVLIEEWRDAPITTPEETRPAPAVAIIGLDTHFGPWRGKEALRRLLYGVDKQKPSEQNAGWGMEDSRWYNHEGFGRLKSHGIEEIAIPFGRYRIPPKEITEMLPQQLLMLQAAAGALQDAGLENTLRNDAGIIAGIALDMNTTNFQMRWVLEEQALRWNREWNLGLDEQQLSDWVQHLREALGPALNANRTIGALGGIVASRVARELRFGGPSFTVSSEDLSGIHALETAVRALQRGELNLAVAGAVDLAADVRTAHAARRLRPQRGGRVSGDGAAAVVLERLDDALAKGRRIYGIIRGMGRAATADEATNLAFAEADISVNRTAYLQLDGMDRPPALFRDNKPATGQVAESVGHTGAASAFNAVVAACLALHDRVIPKGAETHAWLNNRAYGPRVAAVSARGIKGQAAHLVLEGSEQENVREAPLLPPTTHLFYVEGNDAQELNAGIAVLESALRAQTDLSILAHQAWRAPTDKPRTLALIAEDSEELGANLRTAREALTTSPQDPTAHEAFGKLCAGERAFYSNTPFGEEARIAFVFPGSGNHFTNMGRDLSLAWPHVFEAMDAKTGYFAEQLSPDAFWNNQPVSSIDDHRKLLSGQVALGIACSDIVRGMGIQPSGAIGYSLGESVAMFALDAWKDRDSMHLRSRDGDLFTRVYGGELTAVRETWGLADDEPVAWELGVVNRTAEVVRKAMENMQRVYLLIVNTHRECVIGGDPPVVQALVRKLRCGYVKLDGVTAVHCEVLEPAAERYRAHHLFETNAPKGIRFYSGNWGKSYEVTADSIADSIAANARHGLDWPKTIEAAHADGFNVFVEMGPGNSCTRMIKRILKDKRHLAQAVCYQGTDGVTGMLRLVGRFLAERIPVGPNYPLAPLPELSKDPERALRVPVGGKPFQPPKPPAPKQAEPTVSPKPAPRPAPITAAPKPAAAPAVPQPAIIGAGEDLVPSMTAALSAGTKAHEAFLRFSQNSAAAMNETLAWQMDVMNGTPPEQIAQAETPTPVIPTTGGAKPKPPVQRPIYNGPKPFMDRDACLTFAVGRIGDVLGPEFAPIDAHPTRVRLPDEPLMLVDRIMDVGGERMQSGYVITEHDVLPGAWYLDCGRIPTCIAVEAGQADLFLAGYLGIDFETRGKAVYRLLDAVVTFHRDLPGAGETIHYDIKIERFFRQGATWLFRFSFEGSVNGEPLLTMRDGCAGFFSEEELAAGKGIVQTELQKRPMPGKRPEDWRTFVPMSVESYSEAQIDRLRQGDLAGCFGELFANLPLKNPLGIPGGAMSLVDRVTHLEPGGGRFGLGFIRAEADIHPQDWFIVCHFTDDRVMPGTLMYECCLHTLRIYLLRMGWVGEADEVVCHPVIGQGGRLKCRGQVLETTETATYEVTIKELGYAPEPYAVVDAMMYADKKPIVEIEGMSIRLQGLTRERLNRIWSNAAPVPSPTLSPRTEWFTREQILAYAIGNPSECFGDRYKIFDSGRILARLPGPPFMFVDRVTEVNHEPWLMKAGGTVTAEYDIPSGEWYFDANRQESMPFVVLLEIALQPCGFFAAYMGSALTSETDLKFRNLGGNAIQHRALTDASGTLRMEVKTTNVSSSGGMVIQNYDMRVSDNKGVVYEGDTYFGFFSKAALANQIGLREAVLYVPDATESTRAESFAYPTEAPFPDANLRMIDTITRYIPDGGPADLGFIEGTNKVRPEAWFFKAHFYQDPVIPGSLGLESFLQLLKVAAYKRWNGNAKSRFQALVPGEKHEWVYRGQVIPTDDMVTVQAVIKRVDDAGRTLWADGFLTVDGRIIYQMIDFSLSML
ncbi:MAG: beta-ketoacyl synthase N-terminal-like domain-containing protein [Acidobacteriota bacterium]|nr:beta-ketoacyl synthase N-terminal-like domain-containing protein [Acidobacteriota bacterium]